MAPRTRNKIPLTDEEKRRKRKEYDRQRRERMKSDAVLLAESRRKETEKWHMKLKKKQRKLVMDMTEREKRRQRKIWREDGEKRKLRKEQCLKANEAPTMSIEEPTSQVKSADRQMRCLRIGLKRLRELREQDAKKLKELQDQNKSQRRTIERLRKRETRNKKAAVTASPASKTRHLLNSGTSKQIARRVLFAETISHALEEGYKDLSTQKEKKQVSALIANNAKYFKKYRLKKELNFISSKVFHMNYEHRSNNKHFRMGIKKLKTQVESDVLKFFEDDDHSRLCPGKRDFVVQKQVKRQKRFLSGTLKNLHLKFCEKMGYRLSYTTFCRLKPFWVVHRKATERDTCVCKTHENMELLVTSLYSAGMLEDKSVSELLKTLCCNASATACLMRKCETCCGSVIPYKQFDSDAQITYLQWNLVKEKITLRNKKQKIVTHWAREPVKSTKFTAVDFLESQIGKFMQHEAIMIHQARQFKWLRMNMTEKEVLIHCDFSENYSAKLNTEIQSFHFGGSRKQFTLHTVQVYYKKTAYCMLQSQSVCTLSEVNDHRAHAVWAHISPVLDFVFRNAPNVEIIHFQSDCPSTQYRNRTMFFLISHLFAEKGNVKTVTWNYSAPGHGKGAPDGVGGCLKRTADRVVAEGGDIINFTDFVETLQNNTRNISLHIVNQEDIDRVLKKIPPSLPTFSGTMKVHQIVFHKSSPGLLRMKSLSCFNCLDCDDYLIGDFKTARAKEAPPSRYQENPPLPSEDAEKNDECCSSPPSPDLETDENQPLENPRKDNGQFQPLPDTDFPPVGSYVLASRAGSSTSKSNSSFVCYVVGWSSADHVMVHLLNPVKDSRHSFVIDAASGAVKLRTKDIMRILPSPTIRIKGKILVRAFPHDVIFDREGN